MLEVYYKSPRGLFTNNTKKLSITDSSGATESVAIRTGFLDIGFLGTGESPATVIWIQIGTSPIARVDKDLFLFPGVHYRMPWKNDDKIAGICESGLTASLYWHPVA